MLISIDIESHRLNQVLLNDVREHEFLIDAKKLEIYHFQRAEVTDQTKEAIYRTSLSSLTTRGYLGVSKISPNLELQKAASN